MSSTEKYFKFFKNFTRDYSKLVLSSFYKGSLIKDLITEYINIRYYNLYEQKNKNSSKNIQYYMELKCKKLTDIYDKDMISKSLYFIWYITYLDNINKCDDVNTLIENIIDNREKILCINDDIKKELSSYFDYKKKIVNIEAEINELHENESGLPNGGMDITGVRAKGYKKNITEAMAISNIIKENKLLNRKEKLERKINFLEKLADSLREDEKTIIKGFYIKGKTNRKIALELDITIEAVKKRKKRILIRLQNEYKR